MAEEEGGSGGPDEVEHLQGSVVGVQEFGGSDTPTGPEPWVTKEGGLGDGVRGGWRVQSEEPL